jgi:hypothetical protein
MGFGAAWILRVLPAWAALAAMLFASAAPVLAGHAAVDRDCAPAATAHDHAAHRLSQLPEPGADHCAACHLTRSVRGASFAQNLHAFIPLASFTLQPDSAAPRRGDLRTHATRGPPNL